ncbi:SinI family autotransporter-associated protein [Escherichia coli]|uniref:SinI family autotransporter-associated protein n=1 Tax=Escherichia coli TaxID=562 RepID=UPI003B973D22
MQQETKRGLTKIALALVLAGYCAVPAALAETTADGWIMESQSTGEFNGTVPWIFRSDSKQTDADKAHVTVTVDRSGRADPTPDDGSEEWKRLHVGDKVTVSWAIGDTEGDVDNNGTLNAATKATIKWKSYSDNNASNGTAIGTDGSDSYTITSADRGRYLGLDITPTTTSGIPTVGTLVQVKDLTTDAGGGGDYPSGGDIPSGPVINDNLHVSIYKDGTQTNLLGKTAAIELNATYKVLLWSDENNNDQYDTGEDVTTNYHYRWRFTGTSKSSTPGAAGGLVAESKWDNPLVVPVTNLEAKTAFDNTNSGGVIIGADGVQGYGLSIDYKHK